MVPARQYDRSEYIREISVDPASRQRQPIGCCDPEIPDEPEKRWDLNLPGNGRIVPFKTENPALSSEFQNRFVVENS